MLIGSRWLARPHARSAVARALELKKPIIVVLIGRSEMPARETFPDTLAALADQPVMKLEQATFAEDCKALVAAIADAVPGIAPSPLASPRRWRYVQFATGLAGAILGIAAYEISRSVLPATLTAVRDWSSLPVFRAPEMITIAPGTFLMGSPPDEPGRRNDEGPQRSVAIKAAYQIGKYEVTFAEWDVCVAEGGCKHIPSANGWGRGRRPVIYVSWDDAQQYADWLSKKTKLHYRLPTEAEWEYAARAGSITSYAFGDTLAENQAQHSTDRTAEVGLFKPNAFGVHDMHGNVWEWVEDCYHNSFADAPADGSAWTNSCTTQTRVVRGGAWYNAPNHLRSASRDSDTRDMRYDIVGFRLARTLP